MDTFVAGPGCSTGYRCYQGKARSMVTCGEKDGVKWIFEEKSGTCKSSYGCACVSSCGGMPPPLTCPSGTENMGPMLSASDYPLEFGLLGASMDIINPPGRESKIGLLIGGNYDSPLTAEIEENIVVLGDFKIGSLGVNSLGTCLNLCLSLSFRERRKLLNQWMNVLTIRPFTAFV